jgi:hypothetical protein
MTSLRTFNVECAHAVLVRARIPARPGLSLLAPLLLVLFSARPASAEEPVLESLPTPAPAAADPKGTPPINDDDPESSVPSGEQAMKNPLNMGYFIMALSDRADAAAQRGDHSKEAKYYRAIVKTVPDRSVGYRRACLAHEAAQEWDKATEMCRGALGTGGVTTDDHLKFLKLLLKKPGVLSATEIADADAVVAGFEGDAKFAKDEAWRKLIADAKCQIGAKLEDPERLAVCTKMLRDLKVEPAKLYTFEWAQALAEGDRAAAEQVIEKARQAGLPLAATSAMERGLSKANDVPPERALRVLLRRWWPALIGAGLMLVALLGIMGRRGRPQAA